LPEAMFNFLALLGWSPGEERQRMTRDEMVGLFSFEGIGRAGAVFDLQKLLWLNGQYLSAMSGEEILPRVRAGLVEAGLWDPRFDGDRRPWLISVLELLRARSRTLLDFASDGRPFFSDDYPVDEDAARKHLHPDGVAQKLAALADALDPVEPWTPEPIEKALRGCSETLGVAAAKLIHPARAALTGKSV